MSSPREAGICLLDRLVGWQIGYPSGFEGGMDVRELAVVLLGVLDPCPERFIAFPATRAESELFVTGIWILIATGVVSVIVCGICWDRA